MENADRQGEVGVFHLREHGGVDGVLAVHVVLDQVPPGDALLPERNHHGFGAAQHDALIALFTKDEGLALLQIKQAVLAAGAV